MDVIGVLGTVLTSLALVLTAGFTVKVAIENFAESRPCDTPEAWRARAFGWYAVGISCFFALGLIMWLVHLLGYQAWMIWLTMPVCGGAAVSLAASQGADRKANRPSAKK